VKWVWTVLTYFGSLALILATCFALYLPLGALASNLLSDTTSPTSLLLGSFLSLVGIAVWLAILLFPIFLARRVYRSQNK
jgi:uncharacterized membrane-anchored protein